MKDWTDGDLQAERDRRHAVLKTLRAAERAARLAVHEQIVRCNEVEAERARRRGVSEEEIAHLAACGLGADDVTAGTFVLGPETVRLGGGGVRRGGQ